MTAKPGIIEKIKKLLALAGSANAHEAELAVAKAQEMMTRHQVSERDLNDDPTRIVPGAILCDTDKPIAPWADALVSHVARLNGCASFSSSGTSAGYVSGVAGRPEDIEAVRALVAYLVVEIEKRACWDRPRDYDSYRKGAASAVVEKLEQVVRLVAREVSVTAIVKIDKRRDEAQDYIDGAGPERSKWDIPAGDEVSLMRGVIAGRGIPIRKEMRRV